MPHEREQPEPASSERRITNDEALTEVTKELSAGVSNDATVVGALDAARPVFPALESVIKLADARTFLPPSLITNLDLHGSLVSAVVGALDAAQRGLPELDVETKLFSPSVWKEDSIADQSRWFITSIRDAIRTPDPILRALVVRVLVSAFITWCLELYVYQPSLAQYLLDASGIAGPAIALGHGIGRLLR